MNKQFFYLSIAFIALTLALQGCEKDSKNDPKPDPTPTVTKSVSVGAQSGTLTEKQAGTVTYTVTASNINNGSYSATVANLPGGMSVSGNVAIATGSGTLTLAGNTSTAAGTTSNLTLTIDGATSSTFSLTIAAAPVITITTQPTASTTVTEGEITGSLTVAATVTQGATLSYQWFSNTANNNTGGAAISGATSASYTIPATLTAGAYYYFCEVKATGANSVRSNVATVTVSPPPTPATPFEVSITGTISHTTHTVGQNGTVSFSRFPATVDEWKQAREKIGGEPHGAVALLIMASEMYRRDRAIGRPCIELHNTTANLTSCINRLNDVFSLTPPRPYQMAAYLKGASWQNGYNPTKPYTIEMRVAAGRPYSNSTTYQATVIYIEVISNGHDSGSVPVAVLKTNVANQPGDNGKFFIVFECSSLYLRCREVSATNPFKGLD